MTLINRGGRVRVLRGGRGVPKALIIVLAPIGLLGAGVLVDWLYGNATARFRGPSTMVAYREIVARRTPDDNLPIDLPAQTYQAMTPADAVRLNGSMPFSPSQRLTAARYSAMMEPGEALASSLACLTAAVYYEAGFESVAGKQAVAQVVINRLAHPAFPKTICGVVNQGAKLKTGCQFTFTCDGSLSRPLDAKAWKAAQTVAEGALNGLSLPEVGAATHYHADYVVPTWAPEMLKLVQIGHHIFYRWPGVRALLPPSPNPGPASAPVADLPDGSGLQNANATAPIIDAPGPPQSSDMGAAPATGSRPPGAAPAAVSSGAESRSAPTVQSVPAVAPGRPSRPHVARPDTDMRQSSPF